MSFELGRLGRQRHVRHVRHVRFRPRSCTKPVDLQQLFGATLNSSRGFGCCNLRCSACCVDRAAEDRKKGAGQLWGVAYITVVVQWHLTW